MNSLEALEILRECANGEKKVLFSTSLKLANTIKQDLEAYKQLKQDHDKTLINNGELVVKVADLQKENQNLKIFVDAYANARDKLLIKNEQLEKEIAELKDKIDYLQEEFEGYQSAYEWSQAQNAILKLKIKELEEVKNENKI